MNFTSLRALTFASWIRVSNTCRQTTGAACGWIWTVDPPPPVHATPDAVADTPPPSVPDPAELPAECRSACFLPDTRWIWKMFVRQPKAASMETESQESWLELRDSTLFKSSKEEEADEEREEVVEPFPPQPAWALLLPRESSRRDVSTQTSLSLLRWRIDNRLRMTHPRVWEW